MISEAPICGGDRKSNSEQRQWRRRIRTRQERLLISSIARNLLLSPVLTSIGSRHRERLVGFLSVLSLLGVGLAGIADIVCFLCATAGTCVSSSSSSSSLLLLTAAAMIACFGRTTAGTRPGVGKHSARAFHPSAHARRISVLSAMVRCLAFAGCDNLVFVGRRPTARRIKNSVCFEVFWFGRIASEIQLRISLQMALDLRKNFFGAGWRSI